MNEPPIGEPSPVESWNPASDPLTELKLEMKAIEEIVTRLTPLSPDSRQKVWRYVTDWVAKNLRGGAEATSRVIQGAAVVTAAPSGMSGVGIVTSGHSGGPTVASFESLPDLFAAVDPSTEAEKALVVAIWLQDREGQSEISPQAVNRELSHLGHRVLNITRAFDALRYAKPHLVTQVRKEGSTKQARKSFKVTVEGRKEIERRLRGEAAG